LEIIKELVNKNDEVMKIIQIQFTSQKVSNYLCRN